jgi:four helix bundle protein
MARDHTKLDVFHQAHQLALAIYAVTRQLPPEERFGLQVQLRRAAASVPTNIVEGCVRHSPREYAHFLDIALGSAAEVRYLLDLASDLGLLARGIDECKECSDHVVRALQKLHQAVARFSS